MRLVPCLLLGSLLVLTPPAQAMSRRPKPYHPKTFAIQMTVDFGPAGREGYNEEIYVEKNTTAKEAVSQVYPILSGPVCCSLRDVLSIDGVRCDPEKRRWWIALRNGSKNFSPSRDRLRAGDRIEWKYIQSPA